MLLALLYLCFVFSSLIICTQQSPILLDPVTFNGSTCPSLDHNASELSRIRSILQTQFGGGVDSNTSSGPPCSCGAAAGDWNRVAYLNMTDPDQQCPSNLTLVNGTSFRGCGRTTLNGGGPGDSIIFPVSHNYSSVCGRVIAYQKDVASAFLISIQNNRSLELTYLSGVSLTHGSPGSRQHIWSFAAAIYELSCSNLCIKCCDLCNYIL